MSLDDLLIHRATIERPTLTRDALNNEQSLYHSHRDDVPCRLQDSPYASASDQVLRTVLMAGGVVCEYQLFLEPDADLRYEDRITAVVDEDGVPVESGVWQVERVRRHRDGEGVHHLTVDLSRVLNAQA